MIDKISNNINNLNNLKRRKELLLIIYINNHLFNADMLASIVSGIGTFVAADHATLSRTRPGLTRVCVEVDLLKKLPHEVDISMGDCAEVYS